MPITHDPESGSFLSFDDLAIQHNVTMQELLSLDLDYEDFQTFADAHVQARQALYRAIEIGRDIITKTQP